MLDPAAPASASLASLTAPEELAILARLGRFPAVVQEAAQLREPHRVAFYLKELSHEFQSYFTRYKDDPVLPPQRITARAGWEASWDFEKTRARLAWIDAIRVVYGAGLRLLGITALTRMTRAAATSSDLAEESIT